MKVKFIFLSLTLATLSACANVEPFEREILAQNQMQLDPNELDAAFRGHMYFAREGTHGGFGAEEGMCGCN